MTDEIRDSYRALELEEGAPPEAVKEAYRSLVKVWHPDRFGDDEKLRRRADEKLKQINRAYDVLKDLRPSGRRPSESDAQRETGNNSPDSAGKKRPATRGTHVPHAKIQRAPNMTHARLGCLLVGGVSGALLILILVSLFYDESLSGRRTVTLTPQTPQQTAKENAPEVADERNGVKEASSEPDEARASAVEEVRIEANLAQLEARARQEAIAAANQLPGGNAMAQGQLAPERRAQAGDRSFLSQQFFKNGMAHLSSRAGPREDTKAVEWFRRAAQRGHAGAQRVLAGLLREGRGVASDADKALFWILVAAGQGDEEAKSSISRFEEGVDESGRKAARTLAAEELLRISE